MASLAQGRARPTGSRPRREAGAPATTIEGMLMKLTTQQVEAIDHAGSNLQLIAYAGSGKTEVVAQHVTKLLMPAPEGGHRA